MGERRTSMIERMVHRVEEHIEEWRKRDAARHAEADLNRDQLWAAAAKRERRLAEVIGEEEEEAHRASGYEELEATFGARFRRGAPGASVIPQSAEEVGVVAEIAQRHGRPLSLRGAGTALGPTKPAEGVSLSSDHMKRFSVRDGGEPSVELEPGIPWVELEDHLRGEGKSLRVYPTSAPGDRRGLARAGRARDRLLRVRLVERERRLR